MIATIAGIVAACSPSAREPSGRDESGVGRQRDAASVPRFTVEWVAVGDSRAYLAIPAGVPRPMPGVLVLHTARGLTRDIQHWTDRLAEEGYAALAVDFYHGRSTDNVDEAKALRDEANKHYAESLAMVRGAWDLLAADPRIQARRRAVVGWSFGGAWGTHLAARWPDVNAVVAYYGAADADGPRIAKITAPVLLICGAQDDTAEEVVAFEAALRTHRKNFQVVWNGEGHNFAEPSNVRYSAPASESAYREVRHFLRGALRD